MESLFLNWTFCSKTNGISWCALRESPASPKVLPFCKKSRQPNQGTDSPVCDIIVTASSATDPETSSHHLPVPLFPLL